MSNGVQKFRGALPQPLLKRMRLRIKEVKGRDLYKNKPEDVNYKKSSLQKTQMMTHLII